MKNRNKTFAALLFAGLFTVLGALPSLAADSTVSYEGGAEKFVLIPEDGNLFPGFSNVMPGDSLSQAITIRNSVNADGGVRIYLRCESANETVEGFLEQMSLTVRRDGKVLSANTADQAGGLSKNVLLGQFADKGEISLEVNLTIPLEMDDRFQGAEGRLTWVFTAEEMDSDLPSSHPSGGGGSGSGSPGEGSAGSENLGGGNAGNLDVSGSGITEIGEETTPLSGLIPDKIAAFIPETVQDLLVPLVSFPKTGDAAQITLWAFLAAASLCVLAGLVIIKKKRKDLAKNK